MFKGLGDERLHLLLHHYLSVCGGRPMPSRRDIDPLKLRTVLPVIWLSDHEPAEDTFRYRLAGEEINAAFGTSVACRLLSDLVRGDRFESVNRLFLRVIEEGVALHASGPVYRCTDRVTLGERLVLPLASEAGRPDGLVGVTVRGDTIERAPGTTQEEQMYSFLALDRLAELDSATMAKPQPQATVSA